MFKPRTPPEAIALCSRLLEYTPASRFSPLEACSHAFFDELRQPNTRLPSGRELPMLFNFSPTGAYTFKRTYFKVESQLHLFWLTDCSVVLKSCLMDPSPSVWLITIRFWFVLGQRCDLRGGAINAAYTILLLCDTVLLMCDSPLNKNSSFILCRAVNPAPAELNPHSSSRSLPYSCFRPRWETLMLMLL